ncbi:MAG: hypothetical protein DBX55_00325 [Verrucomicrobia bacterium]|nr:MAG: hypothetical protein DBX55_00325 [Verrucomicrobiota bacterium]
MRKILALFVAASLCACAGTSSDNSGGSSCPWGGGDNAGAAAKKAPRKVGVQMYTLHKFTLEESIPMLKSIGVDAMGLTRGQKLSAKYPTRIGPELSPEARQYLKKLVKDNGMKIVSYGVANGGSKEGIDKIAEFVADIGIPIVLTEDDPKLIPYWDKVAGEKGFIVCIHNHDSTQMKANRYFNPLVVKKTIGNLKNVYACPDNGHWSRSAVDNKWGYNTLAGKIRILHFKDQKEFGNLKNQPVPYGEGELDCKGLLKILDEQGFDGYFLIEHETDWDNNLPAVKKCVEFLRNN